MKLVDGWRSAWKWYSMHAMFWPFAVAGVWSYLPEQLQDAIPHKVLAWLAMSVLISGIVGRLVDQGDK